MMDFFLRDFLRCRPSFCDTSYSDADIVAGLSSRYEDEIAADLCDSAVPAVADCFNCQVKFLTFRDRSWSRLEMWLWEFAHVIIHLFLQSPRTLSSGQGDVF
jgi:hypothetical protein